MGVGELVAVGVSEGHQDVRGRAELVGHRAGDRTIFGRRVELRRDPAGRLARHDGHRGRLHRGGGVAPPDRGEVVLLEPDQGLTRGKTTHAVAAAHVHAGGAELDAGQVGDHDPDPRGAADVGDASGDPPADGGLQGAELGGLALTDGDRVGAGERDGRVASVRMDHHVVGACGQTGHVDPLGVEVVRPRVVITAVPGPAHRPGERGAELVDEVARDRSAGDELQVELRVGVDLHVLLELERAGTAAQVHRVAARRDAGTVGALGGDVQVGVVLVVVRRGRVQVLDRAPAVGVVEVRREVGRGKDPAADGVGGHPDEVQRGRAVHLDPPVVEHHRQ